VVRITGIAIGWIGSTIAFGAVVTLTGDWLRLGAARSPRPHQQKAAKPSK
jgi:hypothetical protein